MEKNQIREFLRQYPESQQEPSDWGQIEILLDAFPQLSISSQENNVAMLQGSAQMVNINRIVALWLYDLEQELKLRPKSQLLIELEKECVAVQLRVELSHTFGIKQAAAFIKRHSAVWKKNASFLKAIFSYKLEQKLSLNKTHFFFNVRLGK